MLAPEFVGPPPLKAFHKKSKRYAEYPLIQAESERQRYWNEYNHPESEDGGYYIFVDPKASDKFPGQEFFKAWAAKTRKLFGIRDAPEEVSGLSTAECSNGKPADESPIATPKSYGTFASKTKVPLHKGYFSGSFRTLRDPHREDEALHTTGRETERESRNLLSEIQIRQHKAELTKLYLSSACISMAIVLDVILSMMTITNRKKERDVVDNVVLFGTICNLLLCVIAVIIMETRSGRPGWLCQSVVHLIVVGNVVVDVLLLRWVFNRL